MRTAILGAGNRGRVYAGYALGHPDQMSISAVIDPRQEWRDRLADAHGVPSEARFSDWSAFAASPPIEQTDAVVNATPDRLHVETAVAVLDAGFPMLLEKPIAATTDGVRTLADRAAEPGAPLVTVAHVLRYTTFYRALRSLVAEGVVGAVLQVTHQKNLWFNHFSHSYVRGNWASSEQSSPFILAKCCHDIDLFGWLLDDQITAATSTGDLHHFIPANRPTAAPDRCTDGCEVDCQFDARKLYLHEGDAWPANTITHDSTIAARQHALETGPFGRCVYACANDAPDHQVAMFEMSSGATVSLTISGHHHEEVRLTTIDGTHGTIVARFSEDTPQIDVYPHRAGLGPARLPSQSFGPEDLTATSAHGGGDDGVMEDFVKTVTVPGFVSGSPIAAAVPSHLAALAAEQSRLDGSRVEIDPPTASR